MTQQTKFELIRYHRKEYCRGSKKRKTEILQMLIGLTGYSRKHLIRALNQNVDIPKKITRERTSCYEPITKHLDGSGRHPTSCAATPPTIYP